MKMLEEDENFVFFETIWKEKVLYERLFNTIHVIRSPEELEKLEGVLKKERRGFSFAVEADKVRRGLSSLESLVLNITEECNLRCSYCIYSGEYSSERHHSRRKMGLETAMKAVDMFMAKSVESPFISFYGGEPLKEGKKIKQIVKYVADRHAGRKVSYSMTTNLTLAAPIIDFLAQKDFVLNISIDGPEDIHDENRRYCDGRPSFAEAYRLLSYLQKTYPDYLKTHAGFSVTIADPANIRKVREFFREQFPDMQMQVRQVEKKFCGSQRVVPEERLEEGNRQLTQMLDEYAGNIISGSKVDHFLQSLFDASLYLVRTRGDEELPAKIWPRGTCVPGARKLFVNTDGRFYMCEKVGERLNLGSVAEGLVENNVFDALDQYMGLKNDLCVSCWGARLCPSCPQSAKDMEGISVEGQIMSCHSFKAGMLRGIGTYAHIMRLAPSNSAGYMKKLEEVIKNGITKT